ncbi:MAG TPA: hypothetical protein VFZ16_16010 [Hyphomicrobiaceae bacterium]|nr:hypothetical protein [Hyphomicrobiaceae bacterium]
MAGRRAGKANPKGSTKSRTAAPDPAKRRSRARPASSGESAESRLEARIAALERECNDLRAALDEERARRRSLEEVYAAARGRISRALDSLQTILSAKT